MSERDVRHVLVVEDEANIREGLVRALRSSTIAVIPARSLWEARGIIAETACDCVLLDLKLPDGDGLDFLSELASSPDPPPVVVATSYDDGERVIRAMRLGAHDYVVKPFDLPALRRTLQVAMRARELARRVPAPVAELDDDDLVGKSEAMRAVWKAIGRAAASNASVLITGPTGAGKEVVARAIHRYSARQHGPFVAVNLAGLPPSLLESELFGHERGAFTGAVARREGRVAAAGGGTLFLDEIGDLAPELQTKLLRLLQERSYERIGGNETVAADVRFIAATHAPVKPGSDGSRLRTDLYYRLAVLEIDVPSLAERPSDIPLLVRYGLERVRARGISDEAVASLRERHWPGNVRELLHVVERAAALAGTDVVDVRHLPEPTPQASRFARELAEQLGAMSMHEAVALVERTMVTVALERSGGNRSRAAKLLGIGRPLLYAKMRQYGLLDVTEPADQE